MRGYLCFVALLMIGAMAIPAVSQEKDPDELKWAPPKKDWEWDQDERFDELMEQLAINEASLEAVQAAIAKKTGRKGTQAAMANRFDENSRLMDRKGGGPMSWWEFYGTNAEKFFYHPIDPNTTYHTDTALRQIGKYEDDKDSSDIPSRQSLPVHQRPPQWDYIYRANRTAREKALENAALLEGEIEQLERRRTDLEREQAQLWCKLAFRAIQRLSMARKPVLRFELTADETAKDGAERAAVLTAAARFLATSLAVVDRAEEDQGSAFRSASQVLRQAHNDFYDALIQAASLQEESETTEHDLGKYKELAQRLKDKGRTLSESYAGAVDGDLNRDNARKESFRGMLQRAVIDYAQILLALNELADTMKRDWNVQVNVAQKLPPPQVAWVSGGADRGTPTLDDLPLPEPAGEAGGLPPIDQKVLRRVFAAAKSTYDAKTGVLTLAYDFKRPDQLKDFDTSNGVPEMRGGAIRVKPGDTLAHKGQFSTGEISFLVKFDGGNRRVFLRAGGSQVIYQRGLFHSHVFVLERQSQDALINEFENQGDDIFRVSLVHTDTRARLCSEYKNQQLECGQMFATSQPIQCELDGNANGILVSNLVISGVPDPEWLASVLR